MHTVQQTHGDHPSQSKNHITNSGMTSLQKSAPGSSMAIVSSLNSCLSHHHLHGNQIVLMAIGTAPVELRLPIKNRVCHLLPGRQIDGVQPLCKDRMKLM